MPFSWNRQIYVGVDIINHSDNLEITQKKIFPGSSSELVASLSARRAPVHELPLVLLPEDLGHLARRPALELPEAPLPEDGPGLDGVGVEGGVVLRNDPPGVQGSRQIRGQSHVKFGLSCSQKCTLILGILG